MQINRFCCHHFLKAPGICNLSVQSTNRDLSNPVSGSISSIPIRHFTVTGLSVWPTHRSVVLPTSICHQIWFSHQAGAKPARLNPRMMGSPSRSHSDLSHQSRERPIARSAAQQTLVCLISYQAQTRQAGERGDVHCCIILAEPLCHTSMQNRLCWSPFR